MEERRKLAKGLVSAHIISFIFAAFASLLSNLVTGLIVFALMLPISAYISPKLMEKVS